MKRAVTTKFPSPLNANKQLSSRIYLPPKIAGNLNQFKAWILQEQVVALTCVHYAS